MNDPGGPLVAAPLALEPGTAAAPADDPALWTVAADLPPDARRFARSLLDPAETARARAFRFPADADTYTATHAGLRLLLGARLGMAPGRLRFTREACPSCGGPHGRPRLLGDEVRFSLSHCRGLGLIGLSRSRIGVDIERLSTPATVEEIADRLHPRESAELRALAGEERAVAFTRIWVRKEAYLKGLGIGLARPLAADYLGAGAVAARLPGWTVRDVRVGERHRGAVAIADP